MEQEFKNFIKAWISAIISISYCYYISSKIKPSFLRFLSVLPVCLLFLLLPLIFSSVHFSGSIAFFLSWLANFKLILFSFNQPPLFPFPSNLSQFICFTCFPIKPQQNPKSQTHLPKWVFAIKVLIFTLILHLYDYKQNLPPFLLLILYSLHIYLELELILMLVKVLIFISLGCEIEPQSNEPYLATSLQDFWGRRWNLMVPAILRPAVYNPVRILIQKWIKSDNWAILLGVLASFLVSGAVHELLFFYITRDLPTGEVFWFFVLHGVCTAVEVAVKKTALVRRWRVNVGVSRLLTVGFVVVTGGWLFFPQLIRSGMIERLANEALLSIDFVKGKFYKFGK